MSDLESSDHLSMSLIEAEAKLLVQLPLNIQKILESSHLLLPLLNFLMKIECDIVPCVAILTGGKGSLNWGIHADYIVVF